MCNKKLINDLFKGFVCRFNAIKSYSEDGILSKYSEFIDEDALEAINNLTYAINEAVTDAIDNKDWNNKIFNISAQVKELKDSYINVRYARRRTKEMIKAFWTAFNNFINAFNKFDEEAVDEVVDESVVDEVIDGVVEDNIKEVRNMSLSNNFDINVDGLRKIYKYEYEDFITKYGYVAYKTKFSVMSDIRINDQLFTIYCEIEVVDGVVVSIHIPSGYNSINSGIGIMDCIKYSNIDNNKNRNIFLRIIDNLRYLSESWCGINGYEFVESFLGIILSLRSYDSNTELFNNSSYELTGMGYFDYYIAS